MKLYSFAALLLLSLCICPVRAEEQNGIYQKITTLLQADKALPTGEILLKAALARQGTPYVAGTLETEPEQLVVKMNETDCILFVESCLALAQTIKSNDPSFAHYGRCLQNLRYRHGNIDGYTSRLHYTSEWIQQAEKNGYVKEVSGEIAHTPLKQTFSFMTTHPGQYKQLSESPENVNKLKAIEAQLNTKSYYYIPKSKVPDYLDQIQPGDIIAFCTSIPGLDLSHVAIAVKEQGVLTFIHASMSAKKVIIEPQSLVQYINSIKSNTGIRVVRPL